MAAKIELPLADQFLAICADALVLRGVRAPFALYEQSYEGIRTALARTIPHEKESESPGKGRMDGHERGQDGSDSVSDRAVRTHLFIEELRVQLALHAGFYKTDSDAPLLVLNRIRDAMSRSELCVPLDDAPAWRAAIERANSVELISAPTPMRHVTLARAVRYFERRGVDLRIIGSELAPLTVTSQQALAATVSSPMTRLGHGAMLLVESFFELRFEPTRGRLKFHVDLSTTQETSERAMPLGHLYRVALSQLNRRPARLGARQSRILALEAAQHLGALYDVQPWSIFEETTPGEPAAVGQRLRADVLYDTLFRLPQASALAIGYLLEDVLVPVAISRPADRDFEPRSSVALWRALRRGSMGTTKGTYIHRRDLMNLMADEGLAVQSSEKILMAFALSRPCADYVLPAVPGLSDAFEAALVRLTDQQFWIAPGALLPAAYFNRAFRVFGTGDAQFNTAVGREFESRMVRRFTDLGARATRGAYGSNRSHDAGDVDLAFETDKAIVLCELKAKALRVESRAGSDVHLLIDIAEGLVHAVNQLCRQEIELLTAGQIMVGDTRLEHRGRRVVKLVISLSDYGPLHDHVTLQNRLESLARVDVRFAPTGNSSTDRRATAASKDFKGLRDSLVALSKIERNPSATRPFFDTYFCSVQFLEEVLEHARTADELVERVISAGRIFTGSREPGADLNYLRQLKRS
jgi:hypothetical protein